MSPELLGLIMIALMVLAIMIGFPTAFTLMALGITFGFLAIGFLVFDLAVQRVFFVMQNDVLVAIPLFLFMGYIIERAGILDELFHAVNVMFGWLPGSLAVATLATGTIFATATGIVGAAVTLLGLLAFPAMLRAGYNKQFAAGAVTASGTLGILIPPSVLLILRGFVPIVSLILFVLGAIFFGLATPSEGAALGALGGIILAAAHRRLSFSMIRESVFLTVRTASMVGWLLVGSSIFAAVFARMGGAQIIGDFILGLNLSPEVFFWVVQIIIFILGWPLEWTEITIIFMPLFLPLLSTYHQQYPDNIATDAFYFGIMAALNQQTSFLSPPVAMSAYYLRGVAGKAITLNEIFTGMYPFLAIQVVSMGVLWVIPWLAYGPAIAIFGPSFR